MDARGTALIETNQALLHTEQSRVALGKDDTEAAIGAIDKAMKDLMRARYALDPDTKFRVVDD
jgi:hypothetical protein